MAARTINDAFKKADIKLVLIQSCLLTTPGEKVEDVIDAAETLIISNLRNQLKDLFSHRCQVFGFKNGCDEEMRRFFEQIFGEEK